jgi:heparin/heparan-sulfate lyase
VAERTWAYADPVGQGFLNQLIEENQGKIVEPPTAYTYFLFYDPQAPAISTATLPTKILFSPHGTGMVIWKSDWSRQGTTIFFKCGNYFDDHGHFDQGHLDVFRQGSLLLDSGAYLTFDGAYRKEYWHKSVAHNTIVVFDPLIENDEGGQRVFHSQSDETMADYLADTLAKTGEILDYKIEKEFAYAAGDLTKAYPDDRVRRLTREIVFLADRCLVIVDRLVVTRPGLVPKVLWHCPVIPEINPKTGMVKIQRPQSRAILTTLWPPDARLEWVEGSRVGGRFIPAEGHQKGFPDMGVGRVEVSSTPDRCEYRFVHTIDIADNEDPPLPCKIIEGQDRIKITAGPLEVSLKINEIGLAR